MNFIEIKNRIIALNRVRYIDYGLVDEEYYIMFQFEMEDTFTTINFDDENDYIYWLDYLRKKINL